MESSATVARLAPAPALDPRRWWVLALLSGAFFMVILDASIVFVALPSIGADLGLSEQRLGAECNKALGIWGSLGDAVDEDERESRARLRQPWPRC